MSDQKIITQYNFMFWLHVLITVFAWIAPFLINWKLLCSIYLIVIIQFVVFKRCLMNVTHAMDEQNDHTIYSTVFESFGIRLNRKKLKSSVRNYAYIFLGIFTFILQYYFHFKPFLF